MARVMICDDDRTTAEGLVAALRAAGHEAEACRHTMDVLRAAAQPAEGRAGESAAAPVTLDELERRHILRVLEDAGGNRERAAAILGISARTLYRKLREYETGGARQDAP